MAGMMVSEQDDVRLLKSNHEIWSKALEILQKKLPEPTFRSWIKPAQLIDISNDEAIIAVFNEFMRGMVTSHSAKLAEALSKAAGVKLRVKVVFDPTLKTESYTGSISSITVVPASSSAGDSEAMQAPSMEPWDRRPLGFPPGMGVSPQQQIARANLNPKYTFDTFVVGSNSRFSHAAALAVGKMPGQAYNPLFLYGGVGLGKTHLMHAIGHEILRHSPNLSIKYLSCEKFTNDVISSIREDRMADFRKRYRQIDVLLVDDIQFIEGKESTQEEFFHTFNSLRENGRQIVLSSDRPPKALSRLEERLRSRFEWGLIADIQAPDFETRFAILQKKCEQENMRLGDEALEYIANLFTTNIRELEGALIRAHAYGSLTGTPLTGGALSEILHPGRDAAPVKPTLTIEQLIDTVGAHYRIESSELRSAKRSQDLALPRHVAMYLAHEEMQMSFPRIGQAFGNRKHTSAMYAFTRIKDQLGSDPALTEAVRQIRRKLGA